MPQLFSPAADRWFRRLLVIVPAALALLAAFGLYRVNTASGQGKGVAQPVAFSHAQHVGEVGLQCRTCHASAYVGEHGGLPPVTTCLQCHDQLFRGTRALHPLHEAARTGQPIRWQAVTALPAVSRFHHGAHTRAGVGCATCHGAVETMKDLARAAPMTMDWCVDCHRQAQDPASASPIRPVTAWQRDLTDCSVCHY